MKRNKYTKELLSSLVEASTTIAQVLKALNLKQAGGNYCHLKKRINEFGIDTSHFVGSRFNSGSNHRGSNKIPWQEVLVLNRTDRREPAHRLRRALIESGVEYKCRECNQGPEWNGKKLTLEVDHINNNWSDNRKENLRFICPNCHSQIPHDYNQGLTDVTSIARYGREYLKNKKQKSPRAV